MDDLKSALLGNIDGTWSKFVWNLSESVAVKFREGKADFRELRNALEGQPTLTPPNEALTLEELRESPHGKIKNSTLQSICNRANEIASRPPEVSP